MRDLVEIIFAALFVVFEVVVPVLIALGFLYLLVCGLIGLFN